MLSDRQLKQAVSEEWGKPSFIDRHETIWMLTCAGMLLFLCSLPFLTIIAVALILS